MEYLYLYLGGISVLPFIQLFVTDKVEILFVIIIIIIMIIYYKNCWC